MAAPKPKCPTCSGSGWWFYPRKMVKEVNGKRIVENPEECRTCGGKGTVG